MLLGPGLAPDDRQDQPAVSHRGRHAGFVQRHYGDGENVVGLVVLVALTVVAFTLGAIVRSLGGVEAEPATWSAVPLVAESKLAAAGLRDGERLRR